MPFAPLSAFYGDITFPKYPTKTFACLHFVRAMHLPSTVIHAFSYARLYAVPVRKACHKFSTIGFPLVCPHSSRKTTWTRYLFSQALPWYGFSLGCVRAHSLELQKTCKIALNSLKWHWLQTDDQINMSIKNWDLEMLFLMLQPL